jgi:hypothetical protein
VTHRCPFATSAFALCHINEHICCLSRLATTTLNSVQFGSNHSHTWFVSKHVDRRDDQDAWAAEEPPQHLSKVRESHVSLPERHPFSSVAKLNKYGPKCFLTAYSNSIAQWLTTTAKARGYSSPKSKGVGKSAKAPQGKQTYTIPVKEWMPMASFIAGLIEPPVIVPVELATLLDITISLRQSFSEDSTKFLGDSFDQDSSDRHAFFLDILKNIRNISSPLMSEAHAATRKPNTTSVNSIFNIFKHLELEEP